MFVYIIDMVSLRLRMNIYESFIQLNFTPSKLPNYGAQENNIRQILESAIVSERSGRASGKTVALLLNTTISHLPFTIQCKPLNCYELLADPAKSVPHKTY